MNHRWMTLLFVPLLVASAEGQVWKSARWEKGLRERYNMELNILYGDSALQVLDIYSPRNATARRPLLVWFHGGGWGRLSKDSVSGQLIPFLESGWVVANVDYRLAPASLAPAAVVDCRCALAWILLNATRYGIDTTRVVLSGTSAGGHLALITGMLPTATELHGDCSVTVRPAAIVNFYGITDVNDLLDGSANRKGYAVRWLGERPDKENIARAVSPLSYVSATTPPVLTIHGNADPTVPYQHAVRLHGALDSVGVVNQLYTVEQGLHGRFSKDQNQEILRIISSFLDERGIGPLEATNQE